YLSHTNTYAHSCIHTHTHKHIDTHTHKLANKHKECTFKHTDIMQTTTHIGTHGTQTQGHSCLHTITHTNTHTHTHTHSHTHTHTVSGLVFLFCPTQ